MPICMATGAICGLLGSLGARSSNMDREIKLTPAPAAKRARRAPPPPPAPCDNYLGLLPVDVGLMVIDCSRSLGTADGYDAARALAHCSTHQQGRAPPANAYDRAAGKMLARFLPEYVRFRQGLTALKKTVREAIWGWVRRRGHSAPDDDVLRTFLVCDSDLGKADRDELEERLAGYLGRAAHRDERCVACRFCDATLDGRIGYGPVVDGPQVSRILAATPGWPVAEIGAARSQKSHRECLRRVMMRDARWIQVYDKRPPVALSSIYYVAALDWGHAGTGDPGDPNTRHLVVRERWEPAVALWDRTIDFCRRHCAPYFEAAMNRVVRETMASPPLRQAVEMLVGPGHLLVGPGRAEPDAERCCELAKDLGRCQTRLTYGLFDYAKRAPQLTFGTFAALLEPMRRLLLLKELRDFLRYDCDFARHRDEMGQEAYLALCGERQLIDAEGISPEAAGARVYVRAMREGGTAYALQGEDGYGSYAFRHLGNGVESVRCALALLARLGDPLVCTSDCRPFVEAGDVPAALVPEIAGGAIDLTREQ